MEIISKQNNEAVLIDGGFLIIEDRFGNSGQVNLNNFEQAQVQKLADAIQSHHNKMAIGFNHG